METLYPGLYLVEQPGEQPIEGTSSSIGAFAGVTERGEIGKSDVVTSWNEFVQKYGSYVNESYLSYAIRGFFENGGNIAYISRVVHFSEGVKTSSAATGTLSDSQSQMLMMVDAKHDGTFGNKIAVEVASYDAATRKFSFKVYEKGQLIEKYDDVTLATIEDIVNPESKLVSLTVIDELLVPVVAKTDLTGGADGISGLTATDYTDALNSFDNDPINLLAIPGNTDTAVIAGLVAYAEKRQDCFVITEVPYGKTPNDARKYKEETPALTSQRLGLYFGWLKVADPIGIGKNPIKIIPNSGHVMGVFARTDATRGVWKAPAGLEANVRGVISVDYNVNDNEQALLNPVGVNVIRAFPGTGTVVWGTRSTSTDGNHKYIPVRRSTDFVEQSILSGTRWAVFEPNDGELWTKLKSGIEDFLRGYWNAGGLKGQTEAEAFFVQIDSTTTTPEDVDAGKVYANIGLAKRKPAEFIVFRVSLRK